jgi:uncharacterized protein YmfQ (DUF2313 family)
MAMTSADYLLQLQELLPQGPAWPREDSYITRLLNGLSQELARVDGRALALASEADPRSTGELLADWERVTGLPDECAVAFGGEQSTAQRRAALLSRLTNLGGQSAAYFQTLAAAMGYTVTVEDFTQHTVEDDVDHPLYSDAWAFVWQVNGVLNEVTEITVEDTVDDPIASWGSALLECVIDRLKPAHTNVLFSYT